MISYDRFIVLLFKVEILYEKDINSLHIHSYIISMWSYPLYILMHVFGVSIKLFNNISCVPKEGKKVIFLIFPQVCFKRNQDFTLRRMCRINRILFISYFSTFKYLVFWDMLNSWQCWKFIQCINHEFSDYIFFR